jgi:CBS domain-containing protein
MRQHKVSEVMTRDVVTVAETSGYREIVEVLAAHRIGALPVVDAHGHVVGVVSEADLLHKLEYAGAELHEGLFERSRTRPARLKADSDIARDLMTSPAIIIGPDNSVTFAARLMSRAGVKRLPVVDDAGRLRGIVARADLLRPFLRTDAAIHDEIRDEVLLRTLWIDPLAIRITVESGIVTLRGEVERRSMVPLVIGLVRGVAGVVDVAAHLTFVVDDGATTTGRSRTAVGA